MSSEHVVVPKEAWVWLLESADHDEGCSAAHGEEYRCRCGFRSLKASGLLDRAAEVDLHEILDCTGDAQIVERFWMEQRP